MSSIKSRIIVIGLATLLSPLSGCNGKSCDELRKDVTNQCCAGKASCSLDESQFDSLCKQADDKCGSNLTCSGSPSGSTCMVQCGCG
jgi:hypothetical protein